MRRVTFLILLLALVGAACSGSPGVAATVDGEDITASDVSALLPGDGDTIDTNTFTNLLYNLIVDEVITNSASEEFGIVVSDAAFQQERDLLVGQLTAQGETLEQALETRNATEVFLDVVVRQQVLITELQTALLASAPAPTEAEIEAEYEAQRVQLTTVCASHILLETEDEAQAAFDRAIAGEDFAVLATELSTGPSGPDGGDLGCTSPASYVTEFAVATTVAEVGVPFGPVESQFGFHVILVSERTEPDLDASRETLVAAINARNNETLYLDWQNRVVSAADVTVAEEYGSWSVDPIPQIVPPGG